MKREKYPDDWNEIASTIKNAAQWKCQVCGKQCRLPGAPFDTHKMTLTVAHLNHDESDCSAKNLMAMCAPCHCRYDARTKAEAYKTGKKTADIGLDLSRVQEKVCRDMFRAFIQKHGKSPRCRDKAVMQSTLPDLSGYGAYKYEFLHAYGCESNPLYAEGWKRIGCVGCPMAAKLRVAQFQRWPAYRKLYIRAFDRMILERLHRGLPVVNWPDGEAVFDWWMNEPNQAKQSTGQFDMWGGIV